MILNVQRNIDLGIDRGYEFLYRLPCVGTPDYIYMSVDSTDVNIKDLDGKIKGALIDHKKKVVILTFKNNRRVKK